MPSKKTKHKKKPRKFQVGLRDNLLTTLEQGAKKILAEKPLPFDVTEVLSLSVGEFHNFITAHNITPEQSDAITDLRSVALMRRAQLTLASLDDSWADIWPHVKRGAAVLKGARSKREDNLNKAIIQDGKKYGWHRSAKDIFQSLIREAARMTGSSMRSMGVLFTGTIEPGKRKKPHLNPSRIAFPS